MSRQLPGTGPGAARKRARTRNNRRNATAGSGRGGAVASTDSLPRIKQRLDLVVGLAPCREDGASADPTTIFPAIAGWPRIFPGL